MATEFHFQVQKSFGNRNRYRWCLYNIVNKIRLLICRLKWLNHSILITYIVSLPLERKKRYIVKWRASMMKISPLPLLSVNYGQIYSPQWRCQWKQNKKDAGEKYWTKQCFISSGHKQTSSFQNYLIIDLS